MINDIVSFEHINVNGVSTKQNFFEMEQLMNTMEQMGAGVMSFNEHKLDTTNPGLRRRVKEVIKSGPTYEVCNGVK